MPCSDQVLVTEATQTYLGSCYQLETLQEGNSGHVAGDNCDGKVK